MARSTACKLANRYGRALPTGYIEAGQSPAVAADDVECLAALDAVRTTCA